MMNIGLLVNFQWYPLKGGGTVHIYQIVRQLVQRGHKIHSTFYYADAPDVKVYRQRELFQFLKNIDLLYIRIDGKFGVEKFTCLKFLKAMNLPVIWEINAPIEEMLMRGKSSGQVRFWAFKRKFLARWVDAAICVSREMQEYAQKNLGIKKVYYVPNGSDIELFSPQKRNVNLYPEAKNHFKVIWAGSSYYAWQGWEIVLQVARKMQTIDPQVKFILITRSRDIKSHGGIPENVMVLDEKNYSELPAYLASADAGLCLYKPLTHNNRFYFSPLKLFDYMACGLPVIATNSGQITEVVKDSENGLLVGNGIDEIIDKILLLKRHPDRAQKISREARRTIEEHYTWERVGRETEKILLDLKRR
jgi:glycosyltransferase involved in cell wall biosynthesis